MEKQKKFHKQTLNSADHKVMKTCAKAIKGTAGAVCAVGMVVANKETLKAVAKGAVNVGAAAVKIIRR